MTPQLRHIQKEHGTTDIGTSRFFLLWAAQLSWFLAGVYLWDHVTWPSSCLPTSFWRVVNCSIHLPDNRGLIETALMVWMWSTAILGPTALCRLRERRL